jgi:isoamylase
MTGSGFRAMLRRTVETTGEAAETDMTTLHDISAARPGRAAPLGASVTGISTNFAVFCPAAAAMELLLYAEAGAADPAAVITLDPTLNRTDTYWHVEVPGVGHGQVYAWRVAAVTPAADGFRGDVGKVLLDPYARAVANAEAWDRDAARRPGANGPTALRAVVVDPQLFDWQGDAPLPPEAGRELIYELHVGAFTRHPSSGVAPQRRGTYAGLTERITHLRDLGVTTVELLPVQHFDHTDAPAGLTNVWGYSPLAWSAPHALYSADRGPTGPVDEFRTLVKALHRAGIRVVLDVVYNHTAEGGADGPVISWRGFADDVAYLAAEGGRYLDVTGCGNTVNANHPVVLHQILDSLRWWVEHMHVDGFRFDLASALCRGEDGEPLADPPLIRAIDSDPVLAGRRLIAEPWDAAGLHHVGTFPGARFAVWNGFVRGDEGTIETLMARLTGSRDLIAKPEARPSHGINFVTCHDGFSLADLVAYDRKHNQDNREGNHDGSDHNLSWNCGIEGPTTDPDILALRRRQARNFLCLLLLANGTPMLTMGDEIGHTRRGNNNPWCQDNELNWFDWSARERHGDLLRFVTLLVRLCRSLPLLQGDRWWSVTSPAGAGDITWHGTEPGRPDWRPASRRLAFTLAGSATAGGLHVMLNAGAESAVFRPPAPRDGWEWGLCVDTAAPPPGDIRDPAGRFPPAAAAVSVADHGLVALAEQRRAPEGDR